MKQQWWFIIVIAIIILAEILVLIYAKHKWFGSFINLIFLLAAILFYGAQKFQLSVKNDLHNFIPSTLPTKKIISEQMLAGLPTNVKKWLTRTNIIGREQISTVYLKQLGKMRTTENGKWMPVKASQYVTTTEPGFIWIADVKAAPFIHLSAKDSYQDGKGHMLIKLLSLVTVVDSRSKEIDQGSMLRYLAETLWFPSAALGSYIHWEEIDHHNAKATMQYKGISASGIFTFDEDGDVKSFTAKRYFDRKEGATLETWLITTDKHGYREFNGIRIPAKSSVTWKLSTGDFTWFNIEVTDIAYNLTSKQIIN